MKQTYHITFFVLFGLALMGGLLFSYMTTINTQTTVVFLNVGQGDAILLSQGKNQILIDGGRTSKELLAHLGRHIPFWDRKIELVIATHPDADHIGGLSGLFRSYAVEKVLTTGAESDTETSRLFQEAAKGARLGLTQVFRGTTVTFPQGGELAVEYPLTPLSKEASDTNEGSMVTRFIYGETSFLLTGDLPHEETVLPEESPVTVLKAAHHGSKYSTSQNFLDRIRPKEAIISVGQNSYGHPDPGVLERLSGIGARIYRTDQQGDIQYTCLDMRQCVVSLH